MFVFSESWEVTAQPRLLCCMLQLDLGSCLAVVTAVSDQTLASCQS